MDYLIFEGYTLEIVFLSDQVKRVKGKKTKLPEAQATGWSVVYTVGPLENITCTLIRMETSIPISSEGMQNLDHCACGFEQGGIFIVPQILLHGALVGRSALFSRFI